MTIRYHPKHDFTRGMTKMTWVEPKDVVLRMGQPTRVGKKSVIAPAVKNKSKRRGRYEVDV